MQYTQGATVGAGIGSLVIQEAIGVFKAYITRVGEGPFITELTDETGDKIQTVGAEFGVTTGRKRRCGCRTTFRQPESGDCIA